jgi:hypothetical protein
METIAPGDIVAHRERVAVLTGLTITSGALGIKPDQSHKSGGGYHCGVQDIRDLGTYPDGDYSTRQPRDRVGGNVASAEDIGDDWPRGGRAAWLRFNNLLVAQLRSGDPALSTLRAVNFSPDGVSQRRYDTLHPEQGIISSTDSVTIHTHLEFWRNTAGTMARTVTLTRVEQIIAAAITNTPLGDDMLTPDEHNLLYNIDAWLRQLVGVHAGPVPIIPVAANPTATIPWPNKASDATAAINAKLDAVLHAQGVTQADLDELQARPTYDAVALAAVLAEHLSVEVSAETVTAALESPAGQAALVGAVNKAEDS